MSAEVRAELATAASGVEGISCSPTYVQLTSIGQACVRLERQEFPDRFGAVVHWNVVVCLGQDMATAEAFFEQKVPALVAALRPLMAIRSATPQQLHLVDGTTVLAAFINGFREE
ncbi:hypothetical protein [Nocardioides sp.]|uniref:hypothetical protein n=1 Tax=Nocardioides sp. TaxID=35761 RepID=UPI003782E195